MDVTINDLTLDIINGIESQKELLDILKNVFGKDNVPFAKHPKNPKIEDLKAYISGLYVAYQDVEERAKSQKEINDSVKEKSHKAKTKAERIREAERLVRVIISDTNPNQTLNDPSGVGEYKTYGNDEIGFKTRIVVYDVAWIIPYALYTNLKNAVYSGFVQRGNNIVQSHAIPRYNIKELPMLTQKDIDEMRRIKASKIAS